MKTVLLTGATGFIGRHCVAPLIARGFDVHALGARSLGAEVPGVTWHRGNLLADPTSLVHAVAPTHLLHLAWYAVPGKYWTSRENLRWVRASLALYDAFIAAGGKRVVMAGSCAEYDWSAGICRERETPLMPATYYGLCKRALGELVAADASAARASAAWSRFFFLYGPHEHPDRLVASVIRGLLRGERPMCSPGTQERDFMHVADAAAATVALLDSSVQGPVNIASGSAISVRDLVTKIVAQIGGEVAFGTLPPDPVPLIVADTARLRHEVGYETQSSLEERLAATIAWWKKRA